MEDKHWRSQQDKFWQWVTRPQDLRDSAADIEDTFFPHSRISKVEALAIYNNAYHQRLIQISSEILPVTWHALGEEAYTALWLDYLAAHPPRSGPIGNIVDHLHDFIKQHPQFGKLPALLDIVYLESHFVSLFDRADEPAYQLEQLQALPPEQWAQTRWQTKQDWTVLSSDFDLQQYWTDMLAYIAADDAEPGKSGLSAKPVDTVHYLIRRHEHRMQFQPISAALMLFLQGLKDGRDFAALCALLAERFPDKDIPSLSLHLMLRSIELELLHA